jgi:hypothetical protein
VWLNSTQNGHTHVDRMVAWLKERPRAKTRTSRVAALAPTCGMPSDAHAIGDAARPSQQDPRCRCTHRRVIFYDKNDEGHLTACRENTILLWPVDCPTSKVATFSRAGLAKSIRPFVRCVCGRLGSDAASTGGPPVWVDRHGRRMSFRIPPDPLGLLCRWLERPAVAPPSAPPPPCTCAYTGCPRGFRLDASWRSVFGYGRP